MLKATSIILVQLILILVISLLGIIPLTLMYGVFKVILSVFEWIMEKYIDALAKAKFDGDAKALISNNTYKRWVEVPTVILAVIYFLGLKCLKASTYLIEVNSHITSWKKWY